MIYFRYLKFHDDFAEMRSAFHIFERVFYFAEFESFINHRLDVNVLAKASDSYLQTSGANRQKFPAF